MSAAAVLPVLTTTRTPGEPRPACAHEFIVVNGVERYCPRCGVVFDPAPVVSFTPVPESPISPPSKVKVKASTRRELFRAQRTATRVAPHRHEQEDRRAVWQVGSGLDAPTVIVERAWQIYRDIRASKTVRRQTRQTVAGVAYVVAYREFGIARTIRDVAKAADVDRFFLGRRCRHIGRALRISLVELPPEAYLRTFLERLGWESQRRARALEALHAYREYVGSEPWRVRTGPKDRTVPNLCASSPTMAAAAVGYVAASSDPRVPWRFVEQVTGLSGVTLRVIARQTAEAVRVSLPTP